MIRENKGPLRGNDKRCISPHPPDMPASFATVGSALPPRRDLIVTAAAAPAPTSSDWGSSINIPRARDRMLEFFEREQLPGDVKQTLAAALNGDLHYQHLLFTAMIDSWPKLQSNIGEIARLASIAPWQVIPFAMRGQDPTPKAETLAKEVEEIVWRMKPDVKRGENNLEEMISGFAMGYFYGHAVDEIRWVKASDGLWKPRATKPLQARFYGYPYDHFGQSEDNEDRLMFDRSGMTGSRNFEDFPDHRFLIGINRGHAGHAATAAPLRALAMYWIAAVYGLKWFINFTQLYGIPWRHAKVTNIKTDRNAVENALANIGSSGYIVTEQGTDIDILAQGSTAGKSLPQRELIDLADKQCDTFILGQTLTSGTDDSGSRALGEIHEGTMQGRVDAVCDFVGRILTYQLLPSIVAVNWGERDDVPEMWVKREEAKDEKALAERDEKIGIISGETPVSAAWFYERHGIPMPAETDKLFQPAPERAPKDKDDTPSPNETRDGLGKPIQAGYNPSQPRVTKGDPGGGQWSDDPSYGGNGVPYRVDQRLKREEDARIDNEASGNPEIEPNELKDTGKTQFEKDREEYRKQQLEEAMADFPEISETMKGKLPRPEDIPADDPMRSDVQLVWDRFRKETRRRDGAGMKVISPAGAAQYFAAKGTRVNLDDLRQEMNEQGFEFNTPSEMIESVYESLEGRKSWGTASRGDYNVAAALNIPATLAKIDKKGLVDEDALAALFADAWVGTAKEDPET